MNLKSIFFENLYPKQTVLKNVFWLGTAQFFRRVLKLVLVVVAARVLGPDGFGTFNYVLSIMALFYLFSDWGIDALVVRDYQQKKEGKEQYIQGALFLRLVLVFIALIFSMAGFFFLSPEFHRLSFFLTIYFFLSALREFMSTLFRAQQKMERDFALAFSEVFFTTGLGVALLLLRRDVVSLGIAYAVGTLFSVVVGVLLLWRVAYIRPRVDKKVIRYFLVSGMPLAFFGILGYIFFSSDQVLLGYFKGTEQVGYYTVATRIISILNVIPAVIMGAFYPYLASQAENKQRMQEIFKMAVLFLVALGVIVSGASMILAPFLVPFIFGSEYVFSVQIFSFFVWILVFMFPSAFLDHFFLSYHKQWQNFFLSTFCALFDLLLNIIFIPIYGIWGALVSSIIGQMLNFSLSLWFGMRLLRQKSAVLA